MNNIPVVSEECINASSDKAHLHADFETFSELDLKKVGVQEYLRHPSTEVLITSLCLDDGLVYWKDGKKISVPDTDNRE